MSKRYILNLKNGNIEDVGAEEIHFGATHIFFTSGGYGEKLEFAIRADLVDTIIEEDE